MHSTDLNMINLLVCAINCSCLAMEEGTMEKYERKPVQKVHHESMGCSGISVRQSYVNLRREVPFPCVELETIDRPQSIAWPM